MLGVDASLIHLKEYGRKTKDFAMGFVSPRMSAQMFFLDFLVYPPIILYCLFMGHSKNPSLLSFAEIAIGYASWTLAEYMIHRFVLHHIPVFANIHQAHHDESLELIGTPTLFSVLFLYAVAYWPASKLFGTNVAMLLFAGFLTGYLVYAAVHYAVHHLGSGGYGFLRKLKRQHAVHHHGTGEHNFGVTTIFWDVVFGTRLAKLNSKSH
jgi:sterol desaturase/sphingolipid hydroxylase (fatty acid hydroxylase superfamily)